MEFGGLARAEIRLEAESGGSDLHGLRIRFDASLAKLPIEAFVANEDRVFQNLILEATATALASHPSHFENVDEIGSERDLQRDLQTRKTVVENPDFFVRHVLPEKTGTDDVYCAPRDNNLVAIGNVHIGEVRREDKVVGLDRGTQEQGTSVPHGEHQFREMTSSEEEYSVLA